MTRSRNALNEVRAELLKSTAGTVLFGARLLEEKRATKKLRDPRSDEAPRQGGTLNFRDEALRLKEMAVVARRAEEFVGASHEVRAGLVVNITEAQNLLKGACSALEEHDTMFGAAKEILKHSAYTDAAELVKEVAEILGDIN